MKKCPTCNAVYKGRAICHRCRTDLRPLLALEAQSQYHVECALKACNCKNYPEMFLHAKRAFMIRKTSETARVYAYAALLKGHFWLALSLVMKIRRGV